MPAAPESLLWVRSLERASVMLSSWNGLLEEFDKSEVVQLVQLLTKLLHAFERHAGDNVEDLA